MNLREERTKLRFTIPQLSQATRISASILRSYEMQDQKISNSHQHRIKKVLENGYNYYVGHTFVDSEKVDYSAPIFKTLEERGISGSVMEYLKSRGEIY